MQQLADRVADLGGAELVGGDLVQERLEGVVVVLVDDGKLDGGVAELLRGADASEAGTEDDDVGHILGCRGHDSLRRERRR